ncbi:MAG: hypothetical protein K2N94_05930 [Lachnospiraceae bacterium]|nr:hypothetical protein [Lachnospiraceae bacterium]
MSEFDKKQYDAKYRKDNYKQISFWFQKNNLSAAEAAAKAHGYDTINAYAKALLEAALAENPNPDSHRGGA